MILFFLGLLRKVELSDLHVLHLYVGIPAEHDDVDLRLLRGVVQLFDLAHKTRQRAGVYAHVVAHGKIRIGFTPDEEVGRGVDYFDVERFGAKFAYTVDGGYEGELEYENFNAASAKVTVQGRNVHPGYAKDKMINALQVAAELNALLPAWERPEHTDGYEGFYHLVGLNGTVENAEISYIIRDHDREKFEAKKRFMEQAVALLSAKYGEGVLTLALKDQYYNMASKIADCMEIVDLAKQAMEACGITPIVQPIRGGTDGARLSFMGLPCPNLFAGGHNFHGPYEYIPVSSMEKAVEMIVKIAELSCGVDFQKKL